MKEIPGQVANARYSLHGLFPMSFRAWPGICKQPHRDSGSALSLARNDVEKRRWRNLSLPDDGGAALSFPGMTLNLGPINRSWNTTALCARAKLRIKATIIADTGYVYAGKALRHIHANIAAGKPAFAAVHHSETRHSSL